MSMMEIIESLLVVILITFTVVIFIIGGIIETRSKK